MSRSKFKLSVRLAWLFLQVLYRDIRYKNAGRLAEKAITMETILGFRKEDGD